MADWLALCRITPVALEATGGSWLPLCALLERRGFEVLRVDPPQVRKIRGRPTSEVPDGQWRQRLHPCGLLASALRPPDEGCIRRRYLRQRAMWLTSAGQPIQPRQKALTQMHITRQHIVSDLTGETGMASMRAILAGERDPVPLAHLRNDRGQHDEATMAKALHGPWREEHLVAVAQAVAL
jgi:transposase